MAAGLLQGFRAGGRFFDGAGPQVLMVHGFSSNAGIWSPMIDLLGADHSLACPTLPGHWGGPGASGRFSIEAMTDYLEGLLDTIRWERPHVCGFSLGGRLGFELAKRDRAASVVAISPGGTPNSYLPSETKRIAWLYQRSHSAARRTLPSLSQQSRSAKFRRVAASRMMVSGDLMSSSTAAEMIRAHAEMPAFGPVLVEMGASGPIVGFDRIQVPVTILWGQRDRVLPFEGVHYFARELPEARIEALPNAGHLPFWDAPLQVADAITARASAP